MNAVDRFSEAYAIEMDRADPLASFRDLFLVPPGPNGEECIYLTGNSLGLQPKTTRAYVEQELDDWAKWGVEGHFHARKPWMPYHENLTEMTARLVGARPHEVVVMNTLTVNLHLMMTSFYRPTRERFKIMMETSPFPSDRYAFESQVRFHGYDPREAIVELMPRAGESTLRHEDILAAIAREGQHVALIILGNPNYLTGQVFDIAGITAAGHAQGCKVGFDLAHGAGNLLLELHAWGPDFAVWCNYKYLNSGPGGLAGCFVHERHAYDTSLPRFAGWWGQNKATRFQMGPVFDPIPGAEGWQLSNPPILQLAALRASMEIFDRATMTALRAKSEKLTGYLDDLVRAIPGEPVEIVTPRSAHERGCQLSLRVKSDAKAFQQRLVEAGVIVDFREPNVVRAAPTPLYNRFIDVYRFAQILRQHAHA
jgi:kynureninase